MLRGMYTDAQWAWLYDRYCEGYSIAELSVFANCNINTMTYHWKRLALRFGPDHRPVLSREAFDALGRREDG